ncbi:hydrolase Nlp/P60 [Microbulbifer flavimaris]|uniref:Hydrolase Nlp/P60 n=1 Tax=Microbulbifer flavimaris TaxID=1781068 RepID=A0ABX4I2Y7_9GAMM|nr:MULTISPECIES: NlpC/P60 family protein [Microbulbifer]KUJ84198.1 hypothetical protein AVO43_00325 [Microbulbifer sp. ZGT114]PCO06272.1 hydrolase Nlp/P60 [Microbulbifer flavimaris]
MNNKLLLILTFFAVTTATGCSVSPYRQPPQETRPPSAQNQIKPDPRTVKEELYAQHREWKGTRYRLGGLSKGGIDCSGLVYATFRDRLGIEIPRSTQYQVQVGRTIRRSDLRPGDLVFFKTGRKVRHVGIYIEDGKFFHASTSKGVTISRLTDYYWRDRYWHARRVALDAHSASMGK